MYTKTSRRSWFGWGEVLSTHSRTRKIQTKGIRSNCLNEVSLQRWRWSTPESRRWTTVGVSIFGGETFSKSVHYSTQRSCGKVEGMASKWPHFVSRRSACGWLCLVNLLFRITSFIYGRSYSLSVITGVMWIATAIYLPSIFISSSRDYESTSKRVVVLRLEIWLSNTFPDYIITNVGWGAYAYLCSGKIKYWY